MRYLLLIPLASLLFGPLLAFGQPSPVPASPDNRAWLDSVQRLALQQQVAAVRARAWRDTLQAPSQTTLCWTGVSAAKRNATPTLALTGPSKLDGCPLLYVVNGQPFHHNDPATTAALQRALTRGPIRQVTLLYGTAAAALYGSRGATGVVVLSDRKAKQRERAQ
ncbi:hypothetical protein [Hymenobacter lapidiphilus]|uniref:TonB-dependent receptor plug domain-containing protein n=1 Tax=Hymenobacter lapidiphilus TaxID=2608003 RepID=A0A7Y7PQS7_9BACT|nr:hypothetical protein [Hymenobacter lapidiphilus]NVO32346.1 hypothetical protein [Hymenobacter lapidiphilus]